MGTPSSEELKNKDTHGVLIEGRVSVNADAYVCITLADQPPFMMDADEARLIGAQLQEAAACADADAMMMLFMRKNGMPDGAVCQILQDWREFRETPSDTSEVETPLDKAMRELINGTAPKKEEGA